jgi:mannosyltransferase
MSTIAAPLERLRAPVARFWALPLALRIALGVAFLAGFSLALRTQAIHARYWSDEGISIGIASHPLFDIPGVLRQDGSPPLYYMLLSVWIDLFGIGEAHTHVLSVAFAVLTVPVAFLAGREIFGVRAGWIAALLFALNPFLTYYAQESRMYALVALLSLIVTSTFVLAFVQRRRAWLPVFALALALLLYTHNWGLFLAVASGATLLALLWGEADRRPLLRDAVLAYGAVALLYAPWLPTMVFQARHTAAPWSRVPTLDDALLAVTRLLGGAAPAMAFGLAVGIGLAGLLAGPRLRDPRARGALAIFTIGAVTLALAWLSSQASPAWSLRYFAVLVAPLLLLGAGGLARAGTLGAVVLVVLAIFWADPRTRALHAKSNAHTAAVLIRDRLEPGDLVVAIHPEQDPLMRLYLPKGLRWANAMGPVADPQVMDWRDAVDRLKAAKPKATANALVESLRSGQHLLLVEPVIRGASWGAPWTSMVRRRAGQWQRRLDNDPRLSRLVAVPHLNGRRPKGVRLVLYERY